MTDNAIPAATVLLLRDEPAFEVLMIERHVNMEFAGGAVVFPGGRIDDADLDAKWAHLCDGFEGRPKDQHAACVAAIREAFEETGILLARDKAGQFVDNNRTEALNHLRDDIVGDASVFLQMIERESLELACDALHLFARWRPPAGATHRRYDTWFFAAKTPPGQQAREDGNEATEAIWTTPQAVLDARDKGERKMIFPTARNVELLNLSNSAQSVFTHASERKIESVEPSIVERDGEMFVTIPDDLGYPVTEEPLTTAFRQ